MRGILFSLAQCVIMYSYFLLAILLLLRLHLLSACKMSGYITIAPPPPAEVILNDGTKIAPSKLPAGKGAKAWVYNYFKPYEHDTDYLYCQLCLDEGL